LLDTKLKTASSIYVSAIYIVIEGLQTLLDLVIFFICIPPIVILTPYKLKYLRDDFKSTKPEEWRTMLLKYDIRVIIDIPYILMLIVIMVSVVQFIKMKRSI
jgi:hypothetical protein